MVDIAVLHASAAAAAEPVDLVVVGGGVTNHAPRFPSVSLAHFFLCVVAGGRSSLPAAFGLWRPHYRLRRRDSFHLLRN